MLEIHLANSGLSCCYFGSRPKAESVLVHGNEIGTRPSSPERLTSVISLPSSTVFLKSNPLLKMKLLAPFLKFRRREFLFFPAVSVMPQQLRQELAVKCSLHRICHLISSPPLVSLRSEKEHPRMCGKKWSKGIEGPGEFIYSEKPENRRVV